MGFQHDQESNTRLMEMDPFPHIPQRDPPPYAYTPLSPTSTSEPSSPTILPQSKTILVPPPPPSESIGSSHIPSTPGTEYPFRTLNSTDPLTTCDAKFADIIMTHVILPRLRVGVLRWKDRETFEFIPQTKDDKKQGIRRSKYDEDLGFIASEYKFRFHAVENVVIQELAKEGYKVKKMRIKEKGRCLSIKWHLKWGKGKKVNARRHNHSAGCCCGGCCCS